MYLIKLHTRNCVCVHMGHLHYARLEDTYIGYFADIKKLFTVSDDESEDEHVRVTKKLKGSSRKSSNQLQDDFNDRNFLDLGYNIGQKWQSFVDKHSKKSDYENLEYFKWNTFEYDLDDWEGYRCFLASKQPITLMCRGATIIIMRNLKPRKSEFAKKLASFPLLQTFPLIAKIY